MFVRACKLLILPAAALAGLVSLPGVEPADPAPERRSFDFVQTVEVTPPAGSEQVRLWIPLPKADDPFQTAQILELASPWPTRISRDAHGNRILHVRADGATEPFQVDVRTRVARTRKTAREDEGSDPADWLGNSALMFVNEEIARRAATAAPKDADDLTAARGIYRQVLESMKYLKPAEDPGWGQGSVEWACTRGFGNCTDYHSLFIAMCRSRGVPARFEIGYPVPLDREAGDLTGYHCWATFHASDLGWVPVDLSEADKHPENAAAFLEVTPPDRVLLSVGRDLDLAPSQTGAPINMFVYPYLEVDGERADTALSHRASFDNAQ